MNFTENYAFPKIRSELGVVFSVSFPSIDCYHWFGKVCKWERAQVNVSLLMYCIMAPPGEEDGEVAGRVPTRSTPISFPKRRTPLQRTSLEKQVFDKTWNLKAGRDWKETGIARYFSMTTDLC